MGGHSVILEHCSKQAVSLAALKDLGVPGDLGNSVYSEEML